MHDLVTKGEDVLGIRLARAVGKIERVILVALVPEAHALALRPHANGTAPHGRPMTEEEILRHQIYVPLGYYALGWIGEQIEPETLFAADIVRA